MTRKATSASCMVLYRFSRVHQTPRVTPAMEAGITDHVWTIEEMLDKVSLQTEEEAL